MGAIKVYKRLVSLFIVVCLLGCGGCEILENLTQDIDGWDLSACVSGFDTCWEFFWDNSEKFENGFVETVDRLTEGG